MQDHRHVVQRETSIPQWLSEGVQPHPCEHVQASHKVVGTSSLTFVNLLQRQRVCVRVTTNTCWWSGTLCGNCLHTPGWLLGGVLSECVVPRCSPAADV